MTKNQKKFNIISIIILIILCIGVTSKEFTGDTFYTIKVGESIINNGVDMIDHFSIHNLSYSYPHWLYDVFIYTIYNYFGLTGIYISTIILFQILILSMYIIINKLTKNQFVSLFVTLISLLTITPFITARAQLVSAILFLYEVYFIEKYIKTRNKKYGIGLILISLLLANIHIAVWPFSFIIYLPYLAEYFIIWLKNTKLIKKQKKIKLNLNSYNHKIEISSNNNLKPLLIIILIALLMGLITPLQDMPFTYIIRTMLGISQKYISEHQPLTPIRYPNFLLLVTLIGIVIAFTKTKIKLSDLLMLSGLLLMALLSTRHIFLFVIVGSIGISRTILNFFEVENDKSINNIVNTFTNKKILIPVILITILYSYSAYQDSNLEYIDKKEFPIQACDYIIDNLDVKKIRLYNDYYYGSYLIYRNIPVFIDARADLYLPEFNKGTKILEDNIEIEKNYTKIFKKYKLTHALVKKKSKLDIILNLDNNYNQIYKDKYFVLYEKVENNEE